MDNKKIGKYLASKRLAKGLTQEQLAARIYVSPKTISKWERGVSKGGLPPFGTRLCLQSVVCYTCWRGWRGKRGAVLFAPRLLRQENRLTFCE